MLHRSEVGGSIRSDQIMDTGCRRNAAGAKVPRPQGDGLIRRGCRAVVGAPARMIAVGADDFIDPSASRCVLSTERCDVTRAHSVTHQLGAVCRVMPGHICTVTELTPLHIAAITPN